MKPAWLSDLEDDAAVLLAEEAVIGATLLEAGARIPPLAADEFLTDRHRLIWDAVHALVDRSEPVDAITVAAELHRQGTWDQAGGATALAVLEEHAAIRTNLLAYARLVRDGARRRALKRLGEELRLHGFDESEIARRLREVPGPMLPDIFDPADAWSEMVAGWPLKPLRTGLRELDEIALGLQPGDFLVIGGRTSMGKTAFVCELAQRYAEQGTRVGFFALEETRRQILRRMLARRTGIPTRRIRDGSLSGDEFRACEDAVRAIQGLPLDVTDLTHLRSLDDRHVAGAVSASDAQVIILDHLQKVDTGTRESRVYGLERVCNALHASALRDGKVVIVTAQLNREAEHRKGPPQKSDLRDSGGLEILARSIWLVYWPWKHDPARAAGEFEVYVEKQGESGTGVAKLGWDCASGRFE
jgi:replicative DNA helicase